jgi:hypothetical protein
MNKNTRRNFKLVQKNANKGEYTIELGLPYTTSGGRSGSYSLKNVPFVVAQPNENGVISQNTDRNMQMKVLHNRGSGAVGNCSTTVHEPIHKGEAVRPYKNSNYGKKPGTVIIEEDDAPVDRFVKIPVKPKKALV